MLPCLGLLQTLWCQLPIMSGTEVKPHDPHVEVDAEHGAAEPADYGRPLDLIASE